MGIGLTDKIEPKNQGFVGMVDADQVIGASGAGGYLPSSTISGNSIQEYQLKISNSPSDTYFLQYKDSTDKLTWAEASAGDVAWSGASDFYGFSSNTALVKSGYAQKSDSQTISHGLGAIPNHVSITPSGMLCNFGVNCKVDINDITVYMTAPGTRDIFWEVSK